MLPVAQASPLGTLLWGSAPFRKGTPKIRMPVSLLPRDSGSTMSPVLPVPGEPKCCCAQGDAHGTHGLKATWPQLAAVLQVPSVGHAGTQRCPSAGGEWAPCPGQLPSGLYPRSFVNPRGDDMTGPLRTGFSSANQLSSSMLRSGATERLNAGAKQPPGVWMHCG